LNEPASENMTGNELYAALETGVLALLLTGFLVTAYVVLRRMASQMHKGVVQATVAQLEEVHIRRLEDGQVHIELSIPPDWKGTVSMAFEMTGEQMGDVFFTSTDPIDSIECTERVPDQACALVIDVPGQKLYRTLG